MRLYEDESKVVIEDVRDARMEIICGMQNRGVTIFAIFWLYSW